MFHVNAFDNEVDNLLQYVINDFPPPVEVDVFHFHESSPRGYSQIFSSIGSKVYSSSSSSFVITCIKQFEIPFLFDLYISSGARPALPMGVALEAMVGFLGGDHRLKNFFELYSFDLACMYKLVHTRSMMSLI
jgi:hypothetical protein